jgi:hypothetical protein
MEFSESHTTDPFLAAAKRLERAVEHLEEVALRAAERDGAEVARLSAALRAAEMEQTSLIDANAGAAERIDNTIGRLRGLLSF